MKNPERLRQPKAQESELVVKDEDQEISYRVLRSLILNSLDEIGPIIEKLDPETLITVLRNLDELREKVKNQIEKSDKSRSK